MVKVMKVVGREILDSRGTPTVEADALLKDGAWGEEQCRPVLQQASTRLLNSVMETRRVIWVKEHSRRPST